MIGLAFDSGTNRGKKIRLRRGLQSYPTGEGRKKYQKSWVEGIKFWGSMEPDGIACICVGSSANLAEKGPVEKSWEEYVPGQASPRQGLYCLGSEQHPQSRLAEALPCHCCPLYDDVKRGSWVGPHGRLYGAG